MSAGYIVARLSQPLGIATSWLERIPYDGRIEYLAASPADATVFDAAMAARLASIYQGAVERDPHGREPQPFTEPQAE